MNGSMGKSFSAAAAAGLVLSILAGLGGCTSDVRLLTNPKASRERGVALYQEGNYADAAGAFRDTIQQDPRDYKAHYYLGVSYDSMKSYHQAIQSYRSCLDVMKETLAGQEDHAFRLKVIETLASAIARSDQSGLEKSYQEEWSKSHHSAEGYFVLAKMYRFSGDPDSAIDAYKHATMLEPKNFLILKDYGMYLIQLGQSQQAAAPLKQAYLVKDRDKDVAAALRQIGVPPETVGKTTYVEPAPVIDAPPTQTPVVGAKINESAPLPPRALTDGAVAQ